jgi:hypothetical protein
VTVNGTGENVTVTFEPTYEVEFLESGLPAGTSWNVTIGPTRIGSTSNNLSFQEPNGSFQYRVDFVPGYRTGSPTGSVRVDGRATNVSLDFGTTVYDVVFTEVGLPTGTPWQVVLAGRPLAAAGDQVIFAEANGTYDYSASAGPGYFTATEFGRVTVLARPADVNLSFVRAYPVVFHEHGLPNDTNWSVSVGEQTNASSLDMIVLDLPNGTQSYEIGPEPGFTTAWTGSVTVNAAGRSVNVTFVVTLFEVSFDEVGLPAGFEWTVVFDGSPASSSGPSLSIGVANGTYSYSVPRLSGWTPSARSGTVSEDGAAALVNVTYLRTYPVTFRETGLAVGTNWTVTIGPDTNSSTSSTLVLDEPNGTVPYSVTPIAGYTASWTGTVRVAGARATVSLTFAPVLYALTFRAGGLPYLTHWQVSIGSTSNGSSGTTIGFDEPNGSYSWRVAIVAGFHPATASGMVTVDGSGPTVVIDFSQTTYTVLFLESGLPSGTPWSLRVAGTVHNATTAALSVPLANGTFAYTVLPVAGYDTPSPGNVTVSGAAPPAIPLSFATPASGNGLTPSETYAIAGGVVLAAAVIVVLLLLVRRRRRTAPTEPPTD